MIHRRATSLRAISSATIPQITGLVLGTASGKKERQKLVMFEGNFDPAIRWDCRVVPAWSAGTSINHPRENRIVCGAFNSNSHITSQSIGLSSICVISSLLFSSGKNSNSNNEMLSILEGCKNIYIFFFVLGSRNSPFKPVRSNSLVEPDPLPNPNRHLKYPSHFTNTTEGSCESSMPDDFESG